MARYLDSVVHPGAVLGILEGDVALAREAIRPLVRFGRLLGSWRVAVLAPGDGSRQEPEDGFPHTHGDVVCLPLSHFRQPQHRRLETLIHELFHVFQRKNGRDVREAMARAFGYRAVASVVDVASANPAVFRRLRSNPDLDGRLYSITGSRSSSSSSRVAVSLFSSDEPRSLSDASSRYLDASRGFEPAPPDDASGRPEYEHPFEHMAYLCAAAVAHRPGAAAWMQLPKPLVWCLTGGEP
jgi:hypothetical protein